MTAPGQIPPRVDMPEGDNPGAGWGLALGTASWAVFIAIFLSGFVRYGGNGYDKPAFLVPVWAWQAIPVVGLLVAIAATAHRRTRALGGGMLIALILLFPVAALVVIAVSQGNSVG